MWNGINYIMCPMVSLSAYRIAGFFSNVMSPSMKHAHSSNHLICCDSCIILQYHEPEWLCCPKRKKSSINLNYHAQVRLELRIQPMSFQQYYCFFPSLSLFLHRYSTDEGRKICLLFDLLFSKFGVSFKFRCL